MPLDPLDAILDAFAGHAVVALGEGNHQNIPGHRFRLTLLNDPRITQVVNDIVVEHGNAFYQDTIDRFIRGEHVSYAELRKVWQDVSAPQATWDVPIYEEFFRAVRDVNRSLPEDQRYRVLLGNTPFDWSRVERFEDIAKQPRRSDAFVADLIEREVLAKNRRALVIYGNLHFLRTPVHYFWNGESVSRPSLLETDSIVSLLERRGHEVFSVFTNTQAELAQLQPDVASWRAPKLAMLAGTAIGAAPLAAYVPLDIQAQFGLPDAAGKLTTTARADVARSGRMHEQFDAVLYLGPLASITYSSWTRELCADTDYLRMRLRRLEIARMDAVAAAAKGYCEGLVAGE